MKEESICLTCGKIMEWHWYNESGWHTLMSDDGRWVCKDCDEYRHKHKPISQSECIKWANIIYETYGKIDRLNIVRLRPESIPLFKKGIKNTMHVLAKRHKREGEQNKPEIHSVVEGSDLLASTIDSKEFDRECLNVMEEMIKESQSCMDLNVFFIDDEYGLFLSEKQK